MGAAEELDSIGKTEDSLTIEQALVYLASIGFDITKHTLYTRISRGTGPARFRRAGRLRFRKCDLDAWKKRETKSYEAYE